MTRPVFETASCSPTRSITQVEVTKDGVPVTADFITYGGSSISIETGDLSNLGVYQIKVSADDSASSSPTEATFTLKVWTWCDDWQLEFDDTYQPAT